MFNVYLNSGSAEIPSVQLGSYETPAAAYQCITDWRRRVASPALIGVYCTDALHQTRGGEYVASYGRETGRVFPRATALGWPYASEGGL